MKKVALGLILMANSLGVQCASVTYDFSHGRFGDNLVAYLHAKWLSLIHNLPLKYRPFPYSDQLDLHVLEQPLMRSNPRRERRLTKGNVFIDKSSDFLYVIPYFSEVIQEHQRGNNNWIYFKVDWDNPQFHYEICRMIAPRDKSLLKVNLPSDCISLAVHMRMGGGYDGSNAFSVDPLKFPPFSFYVEQIKKVSELVGHKKIYAYVFTDDLNPGYLVDQLKKALSNYPNITFDYRTQGNHHDKNVLQDFFALTKFECSIHPLSNFSIIAGKLGCPRIEIFPDQFEKMNGAAVITEVKIVRR